MNKSELLNSCVWYDSFEYIGFFITQLINESLVSGEIPSLWKVSTVHPIPKIANTKDAKNFRPINTMPVDEKLIELIVKSQLTEYIENNMILNKHQSAFRKGHSCETTLNSSINGWAKEIEDGNVVVVVFLDLKRAFETVDRKRMIMKLNRIGIAENEIKWFEHYLQDRRQKTMFKNKCSDNDIVPIGLPQRTALSVLLFLIYINDIVLAPVNAKVIMFADDTTLTVKAKTVERAMELMTEDLEKIFNWLNVNKLKLNVDKTKWMIFTNKNNINTNLSLTIGGSNIERVNKIKYLGVIINDKLRPDDQVKKCVSKAASKVNMLKRLSNKLTFETRKIVYSTIVQPNFDYCSTLYLNATKEQIKSMQKIQNRGMRIILKCDYLTSKKFMLDSLGWLSISH